MSFAPGVPVGNFFNLCSTTSIGATYVQLSASLAQDSAFAQIVNSSTTSMQLAYGPAGSEVVTLYIGPSSSSPIVGLKLDKGMRLAVKALDGTTASVGQLVINLFR